MSNPETSGEGFISRVGEWLRSLAPAVRRSEILEIRNRSVFFETITGMVGPAEPSQVLSTMDVSLAAEGVGELTIEVAPRLSLKDSLWRHSRPKSVRRFKIECDPPEAGDALRGHGPLLDRLASFNSNYLLFEEGVLRLGLPTVIRDPEEKSDRAPDVRLH